MFFPLLDPRMPGLPFLPRHPPALGYTDPCCTKNAQPTLRIPCELWVAEAAPEAPRLYTTPERVAAGFEVGPPAVKMTAEFAGVPTPDRPQCHPSTFGRRAHARRWLHHSRARAHQFLQCPIEDTPLRNPQRGASQGRSRRPAHPGLWAFSTPMRSI